MAINEIKDVLLWCVIFNYAFLLIWSGWFILGHDSLYRLHRRWFKLSPGTFDALHYAGLAIYKVGIVLFALAPWLALCVVF